jgi:hypothetical protein
VLLGVVQLRERAAVGKREAVQVEEDRRGDERAGERAPAGFVGSGDEAPLEGAIEGEEAAAAAGRVARASRCAPGAST